MDISGSNVLVIGGAGLIGSHLVDALLEKKCVVKILDNLEKQTHPHGKPDWIPGEADFTHGDIRNYDDLKKAIEGVDYIFHQAAFGGFTTELSKYIDANSTGTAKIFEVISDNNFPVKKIVTASSQAVYGEGKYECSKHGIQFPSMRPVEQLNKYEWELKCPVCNDEMKPLLVDEDKRKDCETIYGISKFAQERLTIGLGKKFSIPSSALRYAVTYGPRQSIFNPYTGVVSIFSTMILNDVQPFIFEDGLQTRDFLYVSDNVKANIFVMENASTDYDVFNVGTGIPVTITDLTQTLANYYKKDIQPLMKDEFRQGDCRHFVHDSSKINNLGFKASISLKEGIEHYVDWIKSQGDVKEYFSSAESTMRKKGIIHSS